MKNAILYKDVWLAKNSTAYNMFMDWKDQKDPNLAKVKRKNFDDHLKEVFKLYEKSIQG